MTKHSDSRKRLLIVSDTRMFLNRFEQPHAFEPVVRELKAIREQYAAMTWIGYEHGNAAANKSAPVGDLNARLIALPRVGGPGILNKIRNLVALPFYCVVVFAQIIRHDIVFTRAPSIPAFCAILLSFICRRTVFMHKYAGNWVADDAPLFYRLQRRMLQRCRHTAVTINGSWPNQPSHVHSFENPCLTEPELQNALASAKKKKYEGDLSICFVGNIEPAKGIPQLINALENFESNRIKKIVFCGGGSMTAELTSVRSSIAVEPLGFLNREQLSEVYAQSHFLILPSLSEGFPKVVAEAAAFGCIPIVSDISCISQYVHHRQNGFLMDIQQDDFVLNILNEIDALPEAALSQLSANAVAIAKSFTYERFTARVLNITHRSNTGTDVSD